MKLEKFLNPKFIAIIGASSNPEKVGRKIFDNLILNKDIKVFPINNKEKEISKVKAYENIESLAINNWSELLLIIAIPANFVLEQIEKSAKLGIKNIIIISAGFKEFDESGRKIEEDIIKIAKKNKINILGPNCLGFINSKKMINASFSNFYPDKNIVRKNNIAFLSQSGAIGSAVLDWIANKNIGLSHFISLGNKAILNENDFFEFFSKDKSIDLIVAYLEEISDGPRFLEIVSRISKQKPIAILKSGRTESGTMMAASHTGSMAGSYDSILTGLRRSGAIILESVDEIYDLMKLVKGPSFSYQGDLAIVSNAGGLAVLAADQIFEQKITLAEFSSKTKIELKKVLPIFANIKNPLDILGDADPVRFQNSLKIVLSDKKVSSVLVLLTPQSMTRVLETAEIIGKIKEDYPKKIISTCFLGSLETSKAEKALIKYNIPNFDSLESAIKILAKFDFYIKNRKDIKNFSFKTNKNKIINPDKLFLWDYLESFSLLKKYNIESIKTKKIKIKEINNITYPIAVKFSGPDFIHKTDKNAIFLNVKNKQELNKIISNFNKRSKLKNFYLENYIVYQEMLKPELELILGFKRDPVFGPIILLGAGGIYAELYQDVSLEIFDLDRKRVEKMLKSLKFYKLLSGYRAQKSINFELLIDLVLNFAKLVKENDNIHEIDINPLFVSDKGARAIDVRIIGT